MRVLVTRPEPAASATAVALAGLGHAALLAPLLVTAPRRWVVPAHGPQALLVTSANAVRHGGEALLAYRALPVYAVGSTTAVALRAAGFGDVCDGGGDVAAALATADAAGISTLLHLAGADRTRAQLPAGMTVDVRIVYAARRARTLPDAARIALAAGEIDVVLLYSARSAQVFAALADRAGVARGALHVAALSAKVAAAAGNGWRHVSIAATPNEAALFAAAGLVCDKG
ncbi:uroporphyrinogen III synthase HEM4 [Polymorphobacter arshaanensis]|uniref:Uroporphyrinogen III synthase HEM4 n=1 Tax=Glacieibacterium arshaanense TaxID=2511025 RepID=A0A4Y9EKH1_9SPHN|nr:uroporphyrinogen-III synthase [Polymorphobacter arshaanensis]TFU01251.1 uroporphyrinogen III synthase HEM4 [Polymorphobacter arshaanensis]